MAGQAGAIAAGPFDCPDPNLGVLVSELDQLAETGRVGGHGQIAELGASASVHDADGVGVFVGVDTNDDVDDL